MVKILVMILMYFIHLISFAHSSNNFENETMNQINRQDGKFKSADTEGNTVRYDPQIAFKRVF